MERVSCNSAEVMVHFYDALAGFKKRICYGVSMHLDLPAALCAPAGQVTMFEGTCVFPRPEPHPAAEARLFGTLTVAGNGVLFDGMVAIAYASDATVNQITGMARGRLGHWLRNLTGVLPAAAPEDLAAMERSLLSLKTGAAVKPPGLDEKKGR